MFINLPFYYVQCLLCLKSDILLYHFHVVVLGENQSLYGYIFAVAAISFI